MRLADSLKSLVSSYGYVYEFGYEDPYLNKRLTKIGRSNDPDERLKGVNSDLPAEAWKINEWMIWDYGKVEKSYHHKFLEWQCEPKKAGPKAGKNEFFHLSFRQVLKFRAQMWLRWAFFKLSWACALSLPILGILILDPSIFETLKGFVNVFLQNW